MAGKPKMRTIERYLCDLCDKIIDCPDSGFIIEGNIYTANPSEKGGLIGNNIPVVAENEKIDPKTIRKTVLCKNCFLQSVGIEDSAKPKTSIDISYAKKKSGGFREVNTPFLNPNQRFQAANPTRQIASSGRNVWDLGDLTHVLDEIASNVDTRLPESTEQEDDNFVRQLQSSPQEIASNVDTRLPERTEQDEDDDFMRQLAAM